MGDNHKKQKREQALFSSHRRKTNFVMVAMVVLVMVASVLFVQSLKYQLYELSSASLGQTTEKSIQIMNAVIDNEWDRLSYVSHELSRVPPEDEEELLERLSGFYSIDSSIDSWRLSCIDSNGKSYRWDGDVGRWPLPEMLLDSCPDHQITIMDPQDSDAERMVFVYRLPESIQLTQSDVVLTHTVLSFDMAEFDESLAVSAFKDNSFSYITEDNGTRLYHQQNVNDFISAYNILTALENTEFLYDSSFEKMKAASTTDTLYTAEIEREGKRYFVSYAPLSVNNWSLYLFVPEENVGGNATTFAYHLLIQVGSIALLLIAMISAFVLTNSRQTLLRQQLAVDEAHRASQAKSLFLSHMSHDIRTPLNGIMGMCHIAKQRIGDDEAVADCLEKIDLSSHQLMALINDVLDMSRVEQDKVEVNGIPVNLKDIISSCGVHIEVAVNEKEIDFEQNTEGISHPLVFADPVLLEKILTNILGNAAKFTPGEGKISLKVTEKEETSEQGTYLFEIADTGVGMTPEFLEHLFEPFSQEREDGRTNYQGTGLGLSIVKTLVDKLGGTISVDSTLGEGSTFRVELPLDYASETDFPDSGGEPQPFDGSGLKVLLVEDNELNRIIAKTILEECNLTVDIAKNGLEAVDTFKNAPLNQYSVIFMDIHMPVMDGLEASRQIRSLERGDASTVPIIALTADALTSDMEKTLKAGMNDHLGKPIEVNKLYGVLKKYCSDIKPR